MLLSGLIDNAEPVVALALRADKRPGAGGGTADHLPSPDPLRTKC
jgi:hypothetical protein